MLDPTNLDTLLNYQALLRLLTEQQIHELGDVAVDRELEKMESIVATQAVQVSQAQRARRVSRECAAQAALK
jgi:hypothetical protein